MENKRNKTKSVRTLAMMLSEENKRCVIAVAKALIFAQKNEEARRRMECNPSFRRTT